MTDSNGRTAFITGGANGIGLGIARAFAGAGAKVALVDLDEKALERARDELEKVTEVETAVLDVRDRDAFARVADEVESSLGPVSLLFNNAGVAGGAPAGRMTYELWDWGIGINLHGVINGVQTFLPRMIERAQGGHIVNTASGAGLAASGAGVLYHTAKYAVVGMAEALAGELAANKIGVSVLCPGPVATGIIARTKEMQPRVVATMSIEQQAAARDRTERMKNWLERGASPDDVGNWVLDAVKADRFYIHTDRYMAPFVEARAHAILDSMPPETESVQ
jgi:NAD(P)-dependent dehydrogenase (short-subunit alcohol dehydrogenase family)